MIRSMRPTLYWAIIWCVAMAIMWLSPVVMLDGFYDQAENLRTTWILSIAYTCWLGIFALLDIKLERLRNRFQGPK